MKYSFLIVFIAITLVFAGCLKNSSYEPKGGQATMHVYLADDPGLYDKLYIDIQDVQIKLTNDDSDNTGWQSIQLVKKGIYNLLDFKNGADTILGSLSVPAGPVSQMRLILGTNNSVVVNGINYPLQTPSAQQSGLKLLINTTLSAGIDYHFTMDFDAARSIIQTGNGKFILKPTIRIFTEATTGAIQGIVSPASAKAWVYAITNVNDTIASVAADTLSGGFLLKGIPEAADYSVSFHPMSGGLRDTTLGPIAVKQGLVTNLGTLQLQ